MIHVSGFPWCKDAPKEIGLASLVSKILCTHHNNALSPVDVAGKDAFVALREATALGNRRRRERQRRWPMKRFEADGPLLERWFLKTAINVSRLYEAPYVWDITDAPLADVPLPFVATAFGDDTLTAPMGLYAAAFVGEDVNFQDHVAIGTITHLNRALCGFVFVFRGIRFVLWLSHRTLPNPLEMPGEVPWPSSNLSHHLGFVRFKGGRWTSHYVHFVWPGQATPNWVYAG